MPDPIAQYLAAAGAATRQARQQELKDNLNYIVSLVRKGALHSASQVLGLNLPAPLVEAALIQAQRVRAAPEYWEGRIAQQLFAQPGQLQPAPPGSAPLALSAWTLDGGAFQATRDHAETPPEAQTLQKLLQYPDLFDPSSSQHTEIGFQGQMRELVETLKQLLAWLEQRGVLPLDQAHKKGHSLGRSELV